MNENIYPIDATFSLQYAWQLPEGGYIRAIFRAKIFFIDHETDKYTVLLEELVAGRQETATGVSLPPEKLTKEYWALVGQLVGRRVAVAFEATDGQALHMRFATLTGEHKYFSRYDKAEQFLKSKLSDEERSA